MRDDAVGVKALLYVSGFVSVGAEAEIGLIAVG